MLDLDLDSLTYHIVDKKDFPQDAKCYSCSANIKEGVLPHWYVQDGEGRRAYVCSFCLEAYSNSIMDIEEELDLEDKETFTRLKVHKCHKCSTSYVGLKEVEDKVCIRCFVERALEVG